MEVVKILGKASPKLSEEDIYTVPAGKGCVISHINICNADFYDTDISIQIGQPNDFLYNSDLTYAEYGMLVYAKCSAQRLKGVTLAEGDSIKVGSNNEFVTFILFGSEFDQSFQYP